MPVRPRWRAGGQHAATPSRLSPLPIDRSPGCPRTWVGSRGFVVSGGGFASARPGSARGRRPKRRSPKPRLEDVEKVLTWPRVSRVGLSLGENGPVRQTAAPDIDADWWTTKDVAAYLGVAVGAVSSYRRRGQMPAPDQTLGTRTHLWKPARIIG